MLAWNINDVDTIAIDNDTADDRNTEAHSGYQERGEDSESLSGNSGNEFLFDRVVSAWQKNCPFLCGEVPSHIRCLLGISMMQIQ